jgi:SAM-dependent methyltransferase
MDGMATAETFWNKIARKYAARPVADMPAYEDTLARTRRYLTPTDSVLEIGCGTGTTALILSPGVGRYTGTDIATAMLAIAEGKRAEAGRGNLVFRQEAADARGSDGAPFDAILAFSILHLVEDFGATLGAIHGRLAPGGVLISKTACIAELSPVLRLVLRLVLPVMRAFGFAPRVTMLSIPALEAAVTAAGFRIVETHSYGRASRFIVARRD